MLVEIMFKNEEYVYVHGDVDSRIIGEYCDKFNLKSMDKLADYMVDDLFNDINDGLGEGNEFDFQKYPDTEEGFEYVVKLVDIKVDGIKLTKKDYKKVMCDPFDE